MKKFKFELKQAVVLSISGEAGKISARAEFSDSKNQYQVRYKAADGRAVDAWIYETELKADPAAKRDTGRKLLAVKKAIKKAPAKKRRVVKSSTHLDTKLGIKPAANK